MSQWRFSSFLLVSFGLVAAPFAQTTETPESSLGRLAADVDLLLKKDQPPLFAWHLRSLKALAMSEYSKLTLQIPESNRRPLATRIKEFVDYIGAIDNGLRADCSDPDQYLKEGKRGLILARPSQIDGSLQYMMVGLPSGWDPNRTYPLFVALHGSGPDNPLAYPSFGFGPSTAPKSDAPPDPTTGMIHLTPWGRGNRGWRNDAERDLFEALDQLKTFCKLDPDRWYIAGHSSGADGCWAIVQHTPDLWAAAGIQSGSLVSGRPEWGLIPNMASVPVHFLIGEKDSNPERVPDMKEAFKIMTKLHDDTELVVLPGIGHYPLTDQGLSEQAVWMVKHVRTRPSRFSFTVDQAIHPGVWGIVVQFNRLTSRLVKEPWPHFDCEIHGQDVRITTKNVKSLTVDMGPSGLQMKGNIMLIVNGREILNGAVPNKPIAIPRA